MNGDTGKERTLTRAATSITNVGRALETGHARTSGTGLTTVLRDVTQAFKEVVGVSPGRPTQPDIEPADRSTRLAITRTELALERSLMAAERTLMAWVRTSLAMISFGFTLGRLGDALDSTTVDLLFGRMTDIVGVAYYLVIIGTLALILAVVQNRVEVAGLVRQGLTRRTSLAFFIAILLSLLGMFVFTDLVTRFR